MIKSSAFSGEYIIKATGEVKKLVRVYDETQQDNLRVFEAIAGGKWVGFEDEETGVFYTPAEIETLPPKEPYELFGVECDSGWYDIVRPLIDYVEKYNNEHPDDQIVILQVKEKFACLEFYVDNATPELKKMIEEAQYKASRTCECCGDTSDVGKTFTQWYKIICRKCAIEASKEYKYWKRKWYSYNDKKAYIIENGTIKVLE